MRVARALLAIIFLAILFPVSCKKMSGSSGENFALNMLPGVAHATVSCVIGYPFDTVKTRMQTQKRGAFEILRVGFGKDKFFLCRGMSVPLVSLVLKRPLEFAVYETLNQDKTKNFGYFVNGGIAAAVSAVWGCPFNVVKVRMQSQGQHGLTESSESISKGSSATTGSSSSHGTASSSTASQKTHPVGAAQKPSSTLNPDGAASTSSSKPAHRVLQVRDVLRSIHKEAGVLGFFKGLHMNLGFSIPSAGLYLGIYGKLREALLLENDGIGNKGAAGAVAGFCSSCCMWSIMIPVDVIRTQIQVSEKNVTIKDAIRNTYRTKGLTGFWAGLIPVYSRAIIISAPAMYSYEAARHFVAKMKSGN